MSGFLVVWPAGMSCVCTPRRHEAADNELVGNHQTASNVISVPQQVSDLGFRATLKKQRGVLGRCACTERLRQILKGCGEGPTVSKKLSFIFVRRL
jgi:hypothetical protein